jgi:gliding motility-associated-like protein
LGNISFNRIPFLIGTRSIHAKCGDLNGDGKPDLVVSEGGANGDRIYLFRNTSTGAGVFTFSIQSVTLAGKKVKRTDIADLDNDGKPELIVTNQTGNNVTVLVNQSTTAAISFSATHITLPIPGAASTDGLAVEDLDADGLPEIVTSQFLTQTSNIFILKNTSLQGNITFAFNQTLSISGTVVNIKVGDLDGDDKPEIAATQLIGSGTVSIFRNQTAGAITFAAPFVFATAVRPWGLDFGDIDGDKLPDIVVASLDKNLSVLNNESTPGNLDFSTFLQPTTFINRHVGVGDVDGDAKPDIVFTSVDDNNNNILASKVSVFRNKSCLVPVVDPPGPITICSGFPLQLSTANSRGTNYEWKNGAATVANGVDAFYDVTATGNYSVIATGEGGSCSETSNVVSVTVDPGTTSGIAVPANDGPVCAGSTLSLSVNDVTATAYSWTGPNGYTGSGLTPAPIANFQAVNAGRYYLDVIVNGCIAQQASTVVEMISVPDFQVTYTGSNVACAPDTKTLNLVPNDPDFTYQWAERTTGNIGGATGTSVSVNATGDYFVKAQYTPNPSCVAIETDDVTITFSSPPVADFVAPATACTSQVIDFTNQSSGAASMTLFYDWSFGDSQTSTAENPTYQYTTPNTYTVTLSVTYDNGACEAVTSKSITIQSAPAVAITTATNDFSLCAGDTLQLAVNGTFASYQWSTGQTSPTIDIVLPGNYSVDVTTGTCVITAAATIDSLAGPEVIALADPLQVNEGGSTQLTATGLDTYQWDPVTGLSDATISNPVATPSGTTVYTVQGIDSNGCPGSATVEVTVKGDLIVNKLGPAKFISPNNGDDINTFWLVKDIDLYPQCSVTIYDDKGVKVYNAKPYNNDWDGTFNGKQLPDGVYYYVIRCDGEESTPRSGSITVLR